MKRWTKRWARRLRALVHKDSVERELDEELAFHLELEIEKNTRAGMGPDDARRRALIAFGGVERHKEAVRDARTLGWVSGVSLDVKLGARMLVKYPGLTLVGGLAMAFAISVGAATFEFVGQLLDPRLPLPGGDRIVGLRLWDASATGVEGRAAHEFALWREALTSVDDLGAFRTVSRNLAIDERGVEPARVAEVSPSAFRLARVRPLLGRTLVEADEAAGAPPVVVLGYDLWQRRLGGDPDVVGRTVRLGRTATTVVGVMPEGFAFPISHNLWVPLRLRAEDLARREGPAIHIFGRLARGATLASAQAELEALAGRAAIASPVSDEHLHPQVLPYAKSILAVSPSDTLLLMSSNGFLVMLLVLVCGNVALLLFARAATRESEIVVRSALGASRGRIILQLFAEALVLGGVAALLGLAVAGFGLRWALGLLEGEVMHGGQFPFWIHAGLSPATVAYAAALTALGAAIAGVLPALKVTRALQARLRAAAAGGGGLGFGGVWTALIVAQVAVTVAFPATAFYVRRDAVQIRSVEVGFPDGEYLSARLEMDREPRSGDPGDTTAAAFAARFGTTYRELERRLAADPAVAGVTYADRLPRAYHPYRLIEVDDGGAAPLDPRWPGYRVSDASVDPRHFEVLGTPILAGRGFRSDDAASGRAVVIVNQSFVRRVFGGRNPIGRRIRYLHFEEQEDTKADGERGPWYEVVGVVRDMGMAVEPDPKVAGLYHPATPGAAYPLQLAIHVKGDPQAFAPRLREIAAGIDPGLRVYDPMPLDEVTRTELRFLAFWFQLIVLVSGVALLLSLAAIYAVMAFAVSRRTREIGIRVALGCRPLRLLPAILTRPLVQVGLGIAAGAALVAFLVFRVSGGHPTPGQIGLVAAYAALMVCVCLLACIVPTRRALRIEPTEALRTDG